jgi:aquaporin Z
MSVRKLAAEALGTALLVILAVGAAPQAYGFKLTGASTSAGVVTTALAFGLVLLALAYALGPVSGCHVNPAVTMGFLVARRISVRDAVGYWVAQIAGGIAGAVALWGIFESSTQYTKSVGLGTDGYGSQSMLRIGVVGAFAAEVILSFLFVFVVLQVTKHVEGAAVAGLAIGLTLTVVHIVGIPLTGTSVNPARSLGPALVVRGDALNQVWLFVVAPLIGGALAAVASMFFVPESRDESDAMEIDLRVKVDGHTTHHTAKL